MIKLFLQTQDEILREETEIFAVTQMRFSTSGGDTSYELFPLDILDGRPTSTMRTYLPFDKME